MCNSRLQAQVEQVTTDISQPNTGYTWDALNAFGHAGVRQGVAARRTWPLQVRLAPLLPLPRTVFF